MRRSMAGILKRGIIVGTKVANKKTFRDHCGNCRRELITGAARCICGAEFPYLTA